MDRNDQDRMDDRSLHGSQQQSRDDRGMQGSPRQGGYGDDTGSAMDAARSGSDGGNRNDDRTGTTSNQTGSNRLSDEDRMQGRPASVPSSEEGLGNQDRSGTSVEDRDLNDRQRDQI
jgi:hypothetical protein